VKKSSLAFLVLKRRTERKQPQQKRQALLNSTARVLLAVIGIAFSAAAILGSLVYASITHDLPSIEQLPLLLDRENGELLQPTVYYYRDGVTPLANLANNGIDRRFLAIDPDASDHFSLQLTRLSVDVLQPDFWSSSGATALTAPGTQAQTIAERLVRSLLLGTESDSTRTTLRMRLLAAQVVRSYGRSQVLEWYLNSAAFGHLTYSAESAAQLYLHKSAADLDLAEAALLVSLMQAPALNPIDAPTAALENQQALLKQLADQGQINPDEYASAAQEKLTLYTQAQGDDPAQSGFTALVTRQLETELGSDRVERGGLKVITSLDADLQAQLVCTAQNQLAQIEYGALTNNSVCPAAQTYLPTQSYPWMGTQALSAAGVIFDPQTGQVLAYQLPTTLNGETTNPTLQIGSLATPFAALAAFARGVSPASLEWDTPVTLPIEAADQSNPDDQFHGPVSVRQALANDYVAAMATLFNQTDAQTVWSTAAISGLTSPRTENADASLLFGGGNVSLLEVAQAYGTLANEGNRSGAFNSSSGQMDAVTVLQVFSSSGQVILDHEQAETQAVLSRALTYLINNVLSDETTRWTSLGHPNVLEIGRTVAVKTGAVADGSQNWTVGYTPDRLVLTWVGSDSTSSENTVQVGMSAGLWRALMMYTTNNLAVSTWAQPADVTSVQVCIPSGMLPTADCPMVGNDVFLMGNEPTQTDTLYQKLSINRETGLLATVFTPPESIEDQVFLNVPANLLNWASVNGFAVAPSGYDAIASQQTNPLVQITHPSLFAPVSGKVEISGTAAVDQLTSYSVQVGQGINPQSWQQVGETGTSAIQEGTLAEWDTTGLDGLYAIRLNVVNSQNQIETAVIQVTVDNTVPTVTISDPQPTSSITAGSTITLRAEVSDNVSVARVEWWLDGKKLDERSQTPYVALWSATVGKHKLQIKAFDSAGNEGDSESITFQVQK
jgi:membrane peptidoglycan carboxypeptidase